MVLRELHWHSTAEVRYFFLSVYFVLIVIHYLKWAYVLKVFTYLFLKIELELKFQPLSEGEHSCDSSELRWSSIR